MSLRASSVAVDFAAHSALCESKTAACTLAAPFSTGAADTRPQVRTLPEPRVRARFTRAARGVVAGRSRGPRRARPVRSASFATREPKRTGAHLGASGGALSRSTPTARRATGARTPTRARARAGRRRDDAASRATRARRATAFACRRRVLGPAAFSSSHRSESPRVDVAAAVLPAAAGLRSRANVRSCAALEPRLAPTRSNPR